MVLMDGYIRCLSVIPLQTLKANEVVKILDQVFSNNFNEYTKFFTDEGVEFTDKLAKKMYKNIIVIGIIHFPKQ